MRLQTSGRRKPLRWLSAVVVVIFAALLLDGCYYLRAAGGQLDLMLSRQDLDELIADPDTAPALRERLLTVREARDFAHSELALPDNGSYASYVELDRDYVVWNVFAAPELSLEPKRWCYPVAGCVAYRGHFRRERAEAEARRLEADGYDVFVAGVPAYSTLGRLRDPVLSSMFRAHPDDVIATIFHELAHQVVYVPGDTTFNESFATAVAQLGMGRWFARQGDPSAEADYRRRLEVRSGFLEAALATRAELVLLYDGDADAAEKRRFKAQAFDELATRYTELATANGLATAPPAPANNAALVPIGSYYSLVDAFFELFERCDGDIAAFLGAVETIGESGGDEAGRRAALMAGRACPGG